MTVRDFRQLLRDDRLSTIAWLITRRVEEWMNDGVEEVIRCLTLFHQDPANEPYTSYDDEDLIAEAVERGFLDE